jgi:hypothetical protein
MTKPITPSEAKKARPKQVIPDGVIEAFNDLIVKHLNGRTARISITEADKAVREKMNVGTVESWWMNVEDVFQKAGWKVSWDGPGFNESYTGYYTFTAPATRGHSSD